MNGYINPYKLFVCLWIPNWLAERPELSHGAKLCYGRLCQYSGKDGVCCPSQESLAQGLGVSDRQVRRYLDELVDFNLIEAKRGGDGEAASYLFIAHEWMQNGSRPEISDRTHMSKPEIQTGHICHSDRTDMSYKDNNKDNKVLDTTNVVSKTATPLSHVQSENPKDQAREVVQGTLVSHLQRTAGAVTIPKQINFWKACMSLNGYNAGLSFLKKEVGMLKTLNRQCPTSISVTEIMEWFINNWGALRERRRIRQEYPSFDLLFYMREDVMTMMTGKPSKTPARETIRRITTPEEIPEGRKDRDLLLYLLKKQGYVELGK